MIRAKSKGRRIILDERKEVEMILSSPTTNIDYRKIFMIAKYYYEQGLKKNQVEEKLLEYCNKSDVFNIYFFQDMIERILKKAKEYHLKRSDQNIAITKKETEILKVLPHKIYRIALYMLFVAKFEKFQNLSKNKKTKIKSKGFKTYFNYGIRTALYSVEEIKNEQNRFSQKEMVKISKIIANNGIAQPLFLAENEAWEILIADFESKDVEFVIESNLNFDNQIFYYCLKCGNKCEKSKRHDYCMYCYKEIRKEDVRNNVRNHRKDVIR